MVVSMPPYEAAPHLVPHCVTVMMKQALMLLRCVDHAAGGAMAAASL